jgi:hypothetical protein
MDYFGKPGLGRPCPWDKDLHKEPYAYRRIMSALAVPPSSTVEARVLAKMGSAVAATVTQYGQCGGQGRAGVAAWVAPFNCKVVN